MLKKFFIALAVALPLCATAQTPKFGTVNAQEIISAMPEFTEAQNTINTASKQYEDEYAKLNEEIQKLYSEYQQLENDPNTPQSIKERRIQDISDRNTKAQQFVQTAEQDLQRQQAQLMAPIQEKMIIAIKAVGANNNFTMIFPYEVPAYVSAEVIDVTALVKAELGIR